MFKFFSAPLDGATAEYQISNRGFSDFLCTYYCDFLNNVYIGKFFFCCGNGKLETSCRYCSASKEALLLFLVTEVKTRLHQIHQPDTSIPDQQLVSGYKWIHVAVVPR